jgi:hypothetical protein
VDQQKKQKVLIGAMAALILGAGGVFTFRTLSGSSGGAADKAFERGTVERKQRDTDATKTDRGRRKRRERKTTNVRSVDRKERKKTSTRTVRRKGKARGKTKRLKKTDAKPMG